MGIFIIQNIKLKKNKTLNSYSFLKLGSFNNNESDQKKTTKENTK